MVIVYTSFICVFHTVGLTIRNSSNFCIEDFQYPLTIERFCKEISDDKYEISLNANCDTIDWANELLEIPNLYTFIRTKKNNLLSENIKQLYNQTNEYCNKSFSSLHDNQKSTVKKLNRLLLEETYPLVTPKKNVLLHKRLLFSWAPLDIFMYFVTYVIIFHFSFVSRLEKYLKQIINYCVLKNIFPDKSLKNLTIDTFSRRKNYLTNLQIFVASNIEGLLLRKIQIDQEG